MAASQVGFIVDRTISSGRSMVPMVGDTRRARLVQKRRHASLMSQPHSSNKTAASTRNNSG